MRSYELLELFGASVNDTFTFGGSQFAADATIVTSVGRLTAAIIADEKTQTIHIEWPPEDGAVALAMRDGERPEWQEMAAQTANELAVLRATYAPGAAADEYDARLFLRASRERQHAAEFEADNTDSDEPGGLYSLWQD